MDQFCLILQEDSPLGGRMLTALMAAKEFAAWHESADGREFYLFHTDVSRDAINLEFHHAGREQPRIRQVGGMRLHFGGGAVTQTGSDLHQALASTQAILIAYGRGQLYVLCSDDRDAFGEAMLSPKKLPALLDNFKTTGRFNRILINCMAQSAGKA